ncbi:MAG: hypothetical protein ABII90_01790 [Bacteroidota bacterium]
MRRKTTILRVPISASQRLVSLWLIILLNLCNLCFSQDTKTKGFEQTFVLTKGEDSLLLEADIYFENKNYLGALPYYVKLYQLYPGVPEYILSAGICYLYKTDEKDKSVELLEKILEIDPKTEDLNFYLGRAYHLNYRFDDAIQYLNKALTKKKISDERKKFTERLIENCKHGVKLVEKPLDIQIENIGRPVNTKGSEYAPVISCDESVLIFTYVGKKSIGGLQDEYGKPDTKGKYCEDILISYKFGDSWLEPESMGKNINSPGHDACIALSADGQKLFVYKDTEKGSGDIFISELDGNIWITPLRLNININSTEWEGSASLSADEKTLYFSSERSGGYGGRDLYKSTKRDDGIWDIAVNLGPKINSPYNEDAPFIHPDGKTLYFSSEGHNSMGGYDIFITELTSKGGTGSDGQVNDIWSIPVNIGYPINTTDEDKYYVVSANGERGYYSSGQSGGYGQQDIYIVYLGESAKEHALILVKGEITANDDPAEAKIDVTYAATGKSSEIKGESQGIYKSNAVTGNYLINLPSGNNYNITYDVEGFPKHIENVDATEIDTFKTIVIDVRLYSDGYVPQLNIDGNVLYSEFPLRPIADLTIFIRANKDGSVTHKAITDKRGYFRFINLPSEQSFFLSLDEHDPDLIAYSNPIITGHVMSDGKPKQGVGINEVKTKENGSFRLEIEADKFLHTTLPTDKASLDTIDFSDPEIFLEVLDRYGDRSAEDLVFKIQIGAYFKPENFDYSNVTDLGKADIQLLEDGITRFTMGEFKTLKEAEKFRQKTIRRGILDSFILIFYKGERKLFAEVISSDFYASSSK